MAFDKFLSCLHEWASKSLINFVGTNNVIHQKDIWDTLYFRFFLDQE